MQNEPMKKVYSKPEISRLGRLDRFLDDNDYLPFMFDGKSTFAGTIDGMRVYNRYSAGSV